VTPEARGRLEGLLTGQRLLALAVVVDGEPVAGLVPYVVAADFGALYIQASRLARHTRGLDTGGRWSGVVHEPDSQAQDPLQVARLVLEGDVTQLDGESPDFKDAARAFLRRFPAAAMTLQLADFALYRLVLESGRLILGFGQAYNLSRSHFAELTGR
jgi:heme oxygenase (biliverdin-IX-beta and delta-forming)